ncbi:MAG: bacitracin resistance protein BacA [bacterium]|nr:MAG: bacitracin resistance protein BacA [bacterium]
MDREIHTPPGGPPQGLALSPEIYKVMGEENIFKMLEDFYKVLETSSIRSIFPKDMMEGAKKSAAFFVGICGDPPLYMQRYGSPQMRSRHLRFPIDESARQVWLECFETVLEKALEKYQFPQRHLEAFRRFLVGFSAWMVNKA